MTGHKLTVVLLANSLDIGGTERQITMLAKGLHERRHDVLVVLFYGNGRLEKELHHAGVKVHDLRKASCWDILPFLFRLMKVIRSIQPQVIYGFLTLPNILTVLLKPLFPQTRMVWGLRSSYIDFSRYHWLVSVTANIERILSRFCDLVICNSRAGVEYALARGFPEAKMTLIHNGIDPERFKPDQAARERTRAEWGIEANEILIGIVARLDAMKDHPTFLRAAAILARERADVRFVCVGDGPEIYAAELNRLASDLGINEKLTWAGARDDMPAVCNALDVAVSSSTGEGFSNALVEAMACGVPCVATDVGDSAVIVASTGIVVQAADPEALCQGFRLMLTRLGADLRRETRASIRGRFTHDVLLDETIDALQRLGSKRDVAV